MCNVHALSVLRVGVRAWLAKGGRNWNWRERRAWNIGNTTHWRHEHAKCNKTDLWDFIFRHDDDSEYCESREGGLKFRERRRAGNIGRRDQFLHLGLHISALWSCRKMYCRIRKELDTSQTHNSKYSKYSILNGLEAWCSFLKKCHSPLLPFAYVADTTFPKCPSRIHGFLN